MGYAKSLLLIAAVTLLAACTNRANVALTANVPAQYAHVWITVESVWLNTNENAGLDDSGWQKFTLAKPVSFDLVTLTGGTVAQLASNLNLPSGTYRQLRLLLADPDAALADSATAAGLSFNDEVDGFDGQGAAQALPLRLVNFPQGIGISAAFTASTSAGSIFKANSFKDSSLTSSSSAIIDFDAARDLTPFLYSNQPGYFLNPHLSVLDQGHAGTIQGQVDIGAIAADAHTGRPAVQVSAETLSDDGTRHVVVKSAPLRADGSFTLYPLSTAQGDPTQYDLVFHGPAVETVIVKGVPVSSGAPAAAGNAALGTIALAAATSFTVNLADPLTVRGARVAFYQTLPVSGEVPYSIEERPVDPFTGIFAADQTLSAGGLQTAAFGGTLSSVVPAEGAATYTVAGLATLFADGALDRTVASGDSTFSVSDPVTPAGTSANSIGFTLNVTTPGKYDQGALFVTRGGGVVTAIAIDNLLAQPQSSLTLGGLPGGGSGASADAALYYAEVWIWNSADPTGTLSHQPASTVLDLRSGSVIGITVAVQ